MKVLINLWDVIQQLIYWVTDYWAYCQYVLLHFTQVSYFITTKHLYFNTIYSFLINDTFCTKKGLAYDVLLKAWLLNFCMYTFRVVVLMQLFFVQIYPHCQQPQQVSLASLSVPYISDIANSLCSSLLHTSRRLSPEQQCI